MVLNRSFGGTDSELSLVDSNRQLVIFGDRLGGIQRLVE